MLISALKISLVSKLDDLHHAFKKLRSVYTQHSVLGTFISLGTLLFLCVITCSLQKVALQNIYVNTSTCANYFLAPVSGVATSYGHPFCSALWF